MKSGLSPDQSIADVLESLQRSRELLLDPSPQNIDYCRMVMGQCTERLTEFTQDPEFAAHSSDIFVADVRRIRMELASIAGLLTAAAAFRRGMLQAMRSATVIAAPAMPAISRATPAPVIPIDTAGEKARRVHILC